MSNKKRIAKKAKTKSFHSLKKEFGIRLALLQIENRFLRQQIALVQSQRTAPNYPSGGWIPLIDEIPKKRLDLHLESFDLGFRNYQREHHPEDNLPFLQYLQVKGGWTDEDFKRQYLGNPNPASDQRKRSGKIF